MRDAAEQVAPIQIGLAKKVRHDFSFPVFMRTTFGDVELRGIGLLLRTHCKAGRKPGAYETYLT